MTKIFTYLSYPFRQTFAQYSMKLGQILGSLCQAVAQRAMGKSLVATQFAEGMTILQQGRENLFLLLLLPVVDLVSSLTDKITGRVQMMPCDMQQVKYFSISSMIWFICHFRNSFSKNVFIVQNLFPDLKKSQLFRRYF